MSTTPIPLTRPNSTGNPVMSGSPGGVPMLQQVIENVNGNPQVASADTGYWSVANVTAESLQGIDLHVATERQQHGESKDVLTAMRDRLKTEGGLRMKTCLLACLECWRMFIPGRFTFIVADWERQTIPLFGSMPRTTVSQSFPRIRTFRSGAFLVAARFAALIVSLPPYQFARERYSGSPWAERGTTIFPLTFLASGCAGGTVGLLGYSLLLNERLAS